MGLISQQRNLHETLTDLLIEDKMLYYIEQYGEKKTLQMIENYSNAVTRGKIRSIYFQCLKYRG